MNFAYLVDTDWAIDHINGIQRTKLKLKELAADGVAVSIISIAELLEGVHYSRDPEKSREGVEDFLRGFPVLNLQQDICDVFGKERGRLRKRGRNIDDFDLLIAATCIHHDLTLLTNNRRHFEQVEDLRILSLS